MHVSGGTLAHGDLKDSRVQQPSSRLKLWPAASQAARIKAHGEKTIRIPGSVKTNTHPMYDLVLRKGTVVDGRPGQDCLGMGSKGVHMGLPVLALHLQEQVLAFSALERRGSGPRGDLTRHH